MGVAIPSHRVNTRRKWSFEVALDHSKSSFVTNVSIIIWVTTNLRSLLYSGYYYSVDTDVIWSLWYCIDMYYKGLILLFLALCFIHATSCGSFIFMLNSAISVVCIRFHKNVIISHVHCCFNQHFVTIKPIYGHNCLGWIRRYGR